MTSPQPLAAGFPLFTEDDWRAAVILARRGARAGQHNVAEHQLPGFQQGTGVSRVGGRKAGERWSVIQRVDLGDVAAVVQAIREDIAGGANGTVIAVS